MISTEAVAHGAHRLGLRLPMQAINKNHWPHDTQLECFITVGESLEIELVTRNLGEAALDITEALHTYFAVADVRNIQLHGLDGCDYIDKVDGDQRKQQVGPVTIESETDRVYLNTEAECWIDDPGYQRRIRIARSGSRSTVVWNPWVEKAAALGDVGADGYLHMLCDESANALENTVNLAPGAEHRLTVSYQLQSLIRSAD
jgi:D-hexose-6-phosphate mutarotase